MRLIRRLNNISQNKLGKILNIVPSSISKYETSINRPLTFYLIGFCKYFNISCDYLCSKIDEELKIK